MPASGVAVDFDRLVIFQMLVIDNKGEGSGLIMALTGLQLHGDVPV